MVCYLARVTDSIPNQGAAMTKYEQYSDQPETFLRLFGLSVATFDEVLGRLTEHLAERRAALPPGKRGGRKSKLPLSDRLALTLWYLRGYETQLKLGCDFSICESYACKTYNETADLLVKVLRLPSRTSLSAETLGTVIVDATEQPIERPVKGQRASYSGKKSVTPAKRNCLSA